MKKFIQNMRTALTWGFYRRSGKKFQQESLSVSSESRLPDITVLWNQERFPNNSSRTLKIKVRDLVHFSSTDDRPHTLTQTNQEWKVVSPPFHKGNKIDIKANFLKSGTYYYVCEYCPNMKLCIIVEDNNIEQENKDIVDNMVAESCYCPPSKSVKEEEKVEDDIIDNLTEAK